MDTLDPSAEKFCSLGALYKAAYIETQKICKLNPSKNFNSEFNSLWGSGQAVLSSQMPGGIPIFNDNKTHEEVLAAWDKTIIKLTKKY